MSRKLGYFHIPDDPTSLTNFNYPSDKLNFAYDNWTTSEYTCCVSSIIEFGANVGTFRVLNFELIRSDFVCIIRNNKVALPQSLTGEWNNKYFECVNLWICRLRPETKVAQTMSYFPSDNALQHTVSSTIHSDNNRTCGGMRGVEVEFHCVGETWKSVDTHKMRECWKEFDDAFNGAEFIRRKFGPANCRKTILFCN